jgi:exodeoxyribonuclease V alpha subunit
MQLNPAQHRAVEMAVYHPLSVLTGGAGTGKTTVLRLVHDVAERIGVPVLQMALSGRAAQRLRGATGREAFTIAAFLRAAGRGVVDPASEPLIVIDESSMLDLPLTYSLVRALPARARLLLVGGGLGGGAPHRRTDVFLIHRRGDTPQSRARVTPDESPSRPAVARMR